jgi:hypothetical protein
MNGAARPHELPGELILSLTSYPPRFPTLRRALDSLVNQTVAPDRILLWIADDDFAELPNEVRQLECRGVEIRSCADLKSYNKLIPALETFPEAFIATVDDDVRYPPDMLERLVGGSEPSVITCNRAHRIKRRSDGTLAPFAEWEFNVADKAARGPSTDIMSIGAGGVLYPPRALHPMVGNEAMFGRLCPHGDDLWFYWCARAVGTRYKKVGDRMMLPLLRGSQEVNLWARNSDGGNDRMIAALEAELGPAAAGIAQ